MWGEELTVELIRNTFRNLQLWRALYEAQGLETIRCESIELHIWDVELLLNVSQSELPVRQAQAILLFLVENKSEEEVAVWMGIDPRNPVGMYATSGLTRLIELVQAGYIEWRSWRGANAVWRAQSAGNGSRRVDHAGAGQEPVVLIQE